MAKALDAPEISCPLPRSLSLVPPSLSALLARPQKRLLQEAQQRRQLRQASETQKQGAAEAAAGGSSHSSRADGATFSLEQPADEIVVAVLTAAACPYARLGLPTHAPREACRKSYLQLALKLHLYKCMHPRAKEAFTVVEEAYRLVDSA